MCVEDHLGPEAMHKGKPFPNNINYIVVTPAYNEEKYISETITSMLLQKAAPNVWVIVDDGSSDGTWPIVSAIAEAYPWIVAHRRTKCRHQPEDGLLNASEAKAFLEGYRMALATCPSPDFVVKLDGDVTFDSNYFLDLFEGLASDPKLGIVGGTVYEYKGADLIREKVSSAHVRGATKVYRWSCYQDIGGVLPVFGWDVIDEILAIVNGWNVKSFDYVHLTHLRRTASRDGRFYGWARNGYMAYYIGMSPLRLVLRAFFRLVMTGDIIQSFGLVYGYLYNFFRRAQRLPDPSLRKLIRKHQWTTAWASLYRWASKAETERLY